MDKPQKFGAAGTSFGTPTYGGPHEAFLQAQLSERGLPWPRKPLSGKPQLTKGKGGGGGGRSSKGGKSVKLRRSY